MLVEEVWASHIYKASSIKYSSVQHLSTDHHLPFTLTRFGNFGSNSLKDRPHINWQLLRRYPKLLFSWSDLCGETKKLKMWRQKWKLSKWFLCLLKNTDWVHVFLTSFLTHGLELSRAMCQILSVLPYLIIRNSSVHLDKILVSILSPVYIVLIWNEE